MPAITLAEIARRIELAELIDDRALGILYREHYYGSGGLSIRDLAHELGVSVSEACDVFARISERGLAEEAPCPT